LDEGGRRYDPARDLEVDMELVTRSGFLHPDWYRAKASILASDEPARHYLVEGWRNGLEPGPRFEGRYLGPYFATIGYDGPPLITYLLLQAHGWAVYATRRDVEVEAALVRSSGFLDEAGYWPKVGVSPLGLDAAAHYVLVGERSGLSPSSAFDPQFYKHRYPEAGREKTLLGDYIRTGRGEGRKPVSEAAQMPLSFSRLHPSRKNVAVVCSGPASANRSFRIVEALSQRYNVVSVLLDEVPLAARFEALSSIVVGPLAFPDWHPAEAERLVRRLTEALDFAFVVVDMLESRLLLAPWALAFVPTVALVDEAPTDAGSLRSLVGSLEWATMRAFTDASVREAIAAESPTARNWNCAVFPISLRPDGQREPALTTELDRVGCRAAAAMEQRRLDFVTLSKDRSFDPVMWLGPNEVLDRDTAIRHFLARSAALGSHQVPDPHFYYRRARAGFHPQIYATEGMNEHEAAIVNPLAHFLRRGAPPGPWTHPIITPLSPAAAGPVVLAERTDIPRHARVAVHAHFFYPELAEDFLRRLECNVVRPDLLLSTDNEDKAEILRRAVASIARRDAVIRVFPNRGRDIGPFLTGFSREILSYDIVGHFHGKRTMTAADPDVGERWREFLWQVLVGDLFPMADFALSRMIEDESLGLVFAENPSLPHWDHNLSLATDYAGRLGIDFPLPRYFEFPVGTMFWAKPKALLPLFDLQLDWSDYPTEPLAGDGTLLHALERLLPFAAAKAGFTFAATQVPFLTW
jgi:hypothetical protein